MKVDESQILDYKFQLSKKEEELQRVFQTFVLHANTLELINEIDSLKKKIQLLEDCKNG